MKKNLFLKNILKSSVTRIILLSVGSRHSIMPYLLNVVGGKILREMIENVRLVAVWAIHYLFECSELTDERKLFLPRYCLNRPNILKLFSLFTTVKISTLKNYVNLFDVF